MDNTYTHEQLKRARLWGDRVIFLGCALCLSSIYILPELDSEALFIQEHQLKALGLGSIGFAFLGVAYKVNAQDRFEQSK